MSLSDAPFQLRPLNIATDLPSVAELMNMVDTEPVSAEILRDRFARAPAERIHQRMVAVAQGGQIVGCNAMQRDPWMEPGRFWTRVIVHRDRRQQGIGTALYNAALAFVRGHGATHLESEVRDDCPECLQIAQRHGFSIERHTFESRLDLATFDEVRFAGTIEVVEATGIRFFTLADLGNTLDAQQKLYDLNRRTAADNPASAGRGFSPFETFRTFVFEAAWFRADGQIIAADGDKWVGLAAVGYYEQNNCMHNAFTGVERAYRGRKLAQALKLLAIRCARKYGASYIFTDNDAENAPMLAVNRKLGYQTEPGIYRLVCTL